MCGRPTMWEVGWGSPPVTAGRGAYPGVQFPGVRSHEPHPPAALAAGGLTRQSLGFGGGIAVRHSGGGCRPAADCRCSASRRPLGRYGTPGCLDIPAAKHGGKRRYGAMRGRLHAFINAKVLPRMLSTRSEVRKRRSRSPHASRGFQARFPHKRNSWHPSFGAKGGHNHLQLLNHYSRGATYLAWRRARQRTLLPLTGAAQVDR